MKVTIHDITLPRCTAGNQRETKYNIPGENPASAAPSRILAMVRPITF
jgi:hypothetical protein